MRGKKAKQARQTLRQQLIVTGLTDVLKVLNRPFLGRLRWLFLGK
ncbi:MAG TPA: hypothetical protein PKJ99_18195 [Thermoanaerobaculales bacterium]|nr:hypothetical protein [Thermoanaerobaculales bacterium]